MSSKKRKVSKRGNGGVIGVKIMFTLLMNRNVVILVRTVGFVLFNFSS